MNIDEEGNELWSHVYDDLSGLSIGNAVNRTSDGGLIIGGGENIIKTDPYGIRLGINKTWSSRWFSKNEYTKLFLETYPTQQQTKKILYSFPFCIKSGF